MFEHGYNVSLSIAGDGNATKEVRDYIAENDLQSNVYMVGYVRGEEKQKMFKDHDIYCFPTYYGEGMPNSVLEAMAFGMPVVTRPIGGIKDFFQNGYMGYLSESTQPEEIAECIKKIINNKKILCNIALYNHSFAIKNFMASKVARKLINEYEDLHAVQKGN